MRNAVILVSEVVWAAWPQKGVHTSRAGRRGESIQGAKLIDGEKVLGQCWVPGGKQLQQWNWEQSAESQGWKWEGHRTLPHGLVTCRSCLDVVLSPGPQETTSAGSSPMAGAAVCLHWGGTDGSAPRKHLLQIMKVSNEIYGSFRVRKTYLQPPQCPSQTSPCLPPMSLPQSPFPEQPPCKLPLSRAPYHSLRIPRVGTTAPPSSTMLFSIENGIQRTFLKNCIL